MDVPLQLRYPLDYFWRSSARLTIYKIIRALPPNRWQGVLLFDPTTANPNEHDIQCRS